MQNYMVYGISLFISSEDFWMTKLLIIPCAVLAELEFCSQIFTVEQEREPNKRDFFSANWGIRKELKTD